MIILNKTVEDKECIDEVLRIYDENGRIDINLWKKFSKYNISYAHMCHRLGGIKKILSDNGRKYIYYNEPSKECIISRVYDAYKQEGKVTKDICQKYGVSSSSVRNHFGNHGIMYRELGIKNTNPKNITKEELFYDIKQFINKYDSASSTLYRKYGNYGETIVNNYGGWEEILKELNISSNRNSQAECLIESILKDKNIEYNLHKGFDWLISPSGTKMFVDFYLPKLNCIIEYDGQQHYMFVEYYHKTIDKFIECQKRDKEKERLVKEHGIDFYRILYSDDIISELNKIISNY